MNRYIGNRTFYRRLFAVMLPILLQNVITNFVSLLDNIMVGRIGTEPMSGVAIVNQIIFVFNLSIFGGLAGAGIFSAQYHGKGDDEGVRSTMRAKFWIALATLAVFGGVFILFRDRLISFFIHQGNEDLDLAATMDYARAYFRIMLFQMPLFALINVYSSTLRETGETRLPMRAGVAAVFVNLFFNYVLIYGKLGAPRLGVTGAAIATVIARVVECSVIIVRTHSAADRYRFVRGLYRTLRVPGRLMGQIAVKGLPLLLNEFFWSAGMTTLNQTLSKLGLEVLSAENICSTVSNLFFCSFFAMGTTVSILVGQILGSGDPERAVDEDRKLIAFSVAFSTAVAIVMALLAPFIPRIYNTTPAVKALAADFILINAIMMPSNAFTNACYFTLRSGGRVWVTLLFDSAYIWTLSLPVTALLVRFSALPAVAIYAISYGIDIVKCVAGFILVKNRTWVNNLVAQ